MVDDTLDEDPVVRLGKAILDMSEIVRAMNIGCERLQGRVAELEKQVEAHLTGGDTIDRLEHGGTIA